MFVYELNKQIIQTMSSILETARESPHCLTMDEKLDQLSLLPKYGGTSSILSFSILKGINESGERDEVKKALIDVLHKDNEREIQAEIQKKKDKIRNERKSKEMEKMYQNRDEGRRCWGYYDCKRRLPSWFESDNSAMDPNGKSIRINLKGLNLLVHLLESKMREFDSLDSMNVSDSEVVPRVFREKYKELEHEDLPLKWNLETNEILDISTDEIMGKMEKNDSGDWVPLLQEYPMSCSDSDSDLDSDSD